MSGFCGFTGEIDNGNAIITLMMDKIKHRGPHSFGVYTNEAVTLGFRRLIVRDGYDGEQPLYNEDGSIVAVFNGELANGGELRKELSALGHEISSSDDRAVLPHLYEQYGKELLSRLRGMFAFVIYDSSENLLFGARDGFGVKPFYYTFIGENLLFGSEVKSFIPYPGFKAELNEYALEQYLTFQYSVLPETFFKGVYKLMPAHSLTFKDGLLHVEKYWTPKFEPVYMSLEEAAAEIEQAVLKSVKKYRLNNNYPAIGSFLSGGVDSSFIAASSKGDMTFTIGFEYDGYNEIEHAKSLSEQLGITNIHEIVTHTEYFQALPKVFYHMDEPLADPAAVAFYFASQLAAKHVKVAMSGEGPDEFFGGYNIYQEPITLRKVVFLPASFRRFLRRFLTRLPFSVRGMNYLIRAGKTVEERFVGNARIFRKDEREDILKSFVGETPGSITKPFYEQAKAYDDITKMQYIDINLWMAGDIMLQADKMSMAHSLKVLTPFLDREVVSIALKLPVDLRVTKKSTKYAFRKAAARHLPEQIAEKKKLGFPVPIRIWLRDEKYYNFTKEYFLSDTADKYFHTGKLVKLLDEHRRGPADNSRKIWTVLSFLIWYEQYFKKI